MTLTAAPKRPSAATRRGGYVVAVLVNGAFLVAVNGWPGWEAVPFLTQDTAHVTGPVNASIIVNLVANVLYVLHDPRWFKALGDVITTAVGILAMLRIWAVVPFDFGDSSFDWALLAHIMLVVGVVGSVIGIVAALGTFVKSVRGSGGQAA
jgi:hypothetical protein